MDDKNANASSRYILKEENSVWYIDFLICYGALYFCLVNLFIGPVIQNRINFRYMIAELGQKLFYRIDEDVAKYPESSLCVNNTGRVRINISKCDNDSELAEENPRPRVSRIQINEHGQLEDVRASGFIEM